LHPLADDPTILLAVLLGRTVTVAGDLAFYFGGLLTPPTEPH
jgi:hypothetical protein